MFPDFAPGSFTFVPEAGRWVWTTFNEFQWDLNHANPEVFCALFGIMGRLANRGVEVLRLDAAPFIWKRLGTDCENQPEVHDLLVAFRALLAVAAPATVLKAEAIVAPDQLVAYLGAGDPERVECALAYHNQLMVMLWSSLATGEARLMTGALARMGEIPVHASWVTYVRCHDDIGWAVTDEDAAAVGWGGAAHRQFLNDFYSGAFPGLVRPRRAVPAQRGDRRRPHLRHGRLAGRSRGRDGRRRPGRAGAGPRPAGAAARGGLRLRRPAPRLHGRRAGAAQRPLLPGRSRPP